jgi:hypothetical protein
MAQRRQIVATGEQKKKMYFHDGNIDTRGQSSSVSTEIRLRAGREGLNFQQGQWGGDFFFSSHRVQTDSGVNPMGTGVKQPEREDDQSSSIEVKNAWSCTSAPQIRLLGVYRL